MEINGKVYRNLEGQVGYLTDKYGDLQNQIDDIKGKLTHYIIVEELPTEDIDTSAVYLVGPKGTEPNTYYEEWIYVQLEDESWTWEKLGDTASVDLSGYLQKVETVTSYPMVYIKNADGTQGMEIATHAALTNFPVVRRSEGGQINLMDQSVYIPGENQAIGKKYGDLHYIAKDTTTTPYAKAYIKKADGTQDTLSIANTPNQGFLVQYNTAGTLRCKDPTGAGEEAVNLSYANDHYLAKQTGTSTYQQAYFKNADGTQTMVNANSGVIANSVVLRDSNGRFSAQNPVDTYNVATKNYVDAAVGQLLYLHDLEIIINVDATNKLYVKAYLINGSSTAITSFDRILYKRIDVQWGAFGPNMNNAEAVAVTKLPDGFRQEEFSDPIIGFLYQYISNGTLVSGKTTYNMSSTITDTVLSW